jgi:AhpD family alkylhydroperoxidase
MPIFEHLRLEDLAAAGESEFAFVAAPLKLAGSTGCPARPVAMSLAPGGKDPRMPDNVFEVFMAEHAPLTGLVEHANDVLWNHSALDPVIKERLRVALAETIGCSYCARFRTEDATGQPYLEAESETDERKAQAAIEFAVATAARAGDVDDELTVRTQDVFSRAEFSDLVFTTGWFIGMQHVGRSMHWDNACPVAPIRKLVEQGKAA